MCAARDRIWSGEATAIRRHRGIVVFEGGRFGRRKADGLWQNIGGAQPFHTGCCLLRVMASVGHSTRLGNGLSSVCLARLGGLSVLNAITLGSSLSLREQARCDSCMSLFGTLRFGGSMSAMEVGLLASSVSLGSFGQSRFKS